MESSNFRNAIRVFKDHTSITLAKVAMFSDLRVAIVRATGHKPCPAKEHHIREMLTLASYSRCHAASCVATISQRLSKTKDWVVAIKALILIQRLMQEGSPVYMQEVFFATNYNGTHILDMSNFRDASWADSWDFSAFVRAYALYLREQLDSWMQEREGRFGMLSYSEEEDEHVSPGTLVVRTTIPVWEMHNKKLHSRTQHLIKQLDSFIACRPKGAAKNNSIVALALHPLVRQSFQLYNEITDIVSVLLDRFEEFDAVDSTNVFEIFCKVAKQYEDLDTFYYWCNNACIARTSDYPEINKISHAKLDAMDELIKEKSEIKQLEPIHEHELELEPEPEPAPESQPEPESEPEPEPEPESEPEATPTTGGSKEEKKETKIQDIGDLLCFEDDAPTTQHHADQLALALYGIGLVAEASEKTRTQQWEAFDESSDWETDLVQTASQLSKQQPSLPCGFDTLLLDGMYQQGATQAAINSGMMAMGSASSVAFGPTGRPTQLALLPPPLDNDTSPGEDPFAASVAVPSPSYVQMSDIEKKQRLLVEEQMMWQQYQGQVGMANVYMNQSVYNMVG
ncbi:hypothetical protein L1987_32017 [Smallanthus sonchifolius]|uniref:Uncharacterized protein n=1 Tax=Smallanthus sonchifolius TaxID=185202 RepID=A0ACB9I768_9ASTR|nr:hypothetical protein L1987_32017 [Smallanthus sonchifolius]